MIIEKPENLAAGDAFLQSLRKETAGLHTILEELPLSVQLTHPQLSIQEYILYLQKMYYINLFMEEKIFPQVQSVVDDLEQRRKLQLITNDLAYLHTQLKPVSHFSIDMPPEHGAAFALGVVYVMEGSGLGGRIILKNVEAALQLTPCKGASYFAGYQANTGKMWKYLLSVLKQYRLHNNCGQTIIAGAVATFNSIIYYMKQ